MATPTAIAAYLALFAFVGVAFVFVNLLVGRFLRPVVPDREKGETYECGEPAIGSSYVQFDLRFYVVALLFIIFDVEVAFFFPWATVFGKANELADERTPIVASAPLDAAATTDETASALTPVAAARLYELGVSDAASVDPATIRNTARQIAWTAFADIVVFFAVLLVGFAYVWKRGDLDWVRAMTERRRNEAELSRTRIARAEEEAVLSA